MDLEKKYLKYKNKYLNLINQKGGACLDIIDFSQLGNVELFRRSGGGDLYRVMFNANQYIYKEINPRFLDSFTYDILCYNQEYARLSQFNKLATPLFIVRQNFDRRSGAFVFADKKITGYLMNFFDGYQTLNDIIVNTRIVGPTVLQAGRKFLVILKNLLTQFKNIFNSGILPLVEHGGNILVNEEGDVIIIDFDDIIDQARKGSVAADVLPQLNTIFINAGNNNLLRTSPEFLFFFELIGQDYNFKPAFLERNYDTIITIIDSLY